MSCGEVAGLKDLEHSAPTPMNAHLSKTGTGGASSVVVAQGGPVPDELL
jgi:hypothetical protein